VEVFNPASTRELSKVCIANLIFYKCYTILQQEIILILIDILWHIDPLLSKYLETDETTAVARQQRGKQASTTIELHLETVMQPITRQLQKLDYSNGNGNIFYVVRAEVLS
jgi:hypothetical protein